MNLTGDMNHVVAAMSSLVAATRGCCSFVSGEAMEYNPGACCDFPSTGNGFRFCREGGREGSIAVFWMLVNQILWNDKALKYRNK